MHAYQTAFASVICVAVALALEFGEASARTFVVDQRHPKAADNGPGTAEQPFRTISAAAKIAGAGDTVLVHEGVYRERVASARGGKAGEPVVYTAAPDERVVIRGSEVWQPEWRQVDPQKPVYAGRLDPGLFAGLRINPYRTRLKNAPDGRRSTLGQVFVDGASMWEADTEQELAETPGRWMVAADGETLQVHFPPSAQPPRERLVEITVRDRIFAPHRRGLGYIHVTGFVMEHCANQFPADFWRSDSPQAGALGCRAGHHWLIEGNSIRHARSIGIDCGYEGKFDLEGSQPTPQDTGHHVIRNNVVSDNGCCGIAGMRSLGTKIINNVVERNNVNRQTAPEVAGIKVHFFIDGLIEGNLVRDNDAHGIWLDNTYRDARVTRNVVVGNRSSGIFVELGNGPVLIDNNVIANSRLGFNQRDPRGDGLYSHDASGITFAHNLVFGCQSFGAFHRKVTDRRQAGASHIKLINNIFLDNHAGCINLPFPGPHAQQNRSDYNLLGTGDFVVNHWGGIRRDELIARVEARIGHRPTLWHDVDPRLDLDEWRTTMSWDLHSSMADGAQASLSQDMALSIDLGNSVSGLKTVPVAGVTRDFSGDHLAQDGALPGPFQRLSIGLHVLQVWPRVDKTGE